MSAGFGTENIVYVPEGGRLRLLDLYHWTAISLDVHAFRLRLRAHALALVKEEIAEALERLSRDPENLALWTRCQTRAERLLHLWLADAQRPEAPQAPGAWLNKKTEPGHLTLWARISDAPVESFFAEDYNPPPGEEAPSAPPLSTGLPVYGSVAMRELEETEIPIPDTGPEAAFLLELPGESGVRIEPLDPRAPLPLLREYCGRRGASNQGVSANYTLEGHLSTDLVGCAPLHWIGGAALEPEQRAFATLYFHYTTALDYQVSVRIRGPRLRMAEAKIATLGYQQIASAEGIRVWERPGRGDILHVYENPPGRESEGAATLPSFVLATQARGGANPGRRSQLIAELARPGGAKKT